LACGESIPTARSDGMPTAVATARTAPALSPLAIHDVMPMEDS
jgi:hypothetical protein